VAPLVGAIYGGDPAQLSVAATMPRFLEMEERFGSLWRAARRRKAEQADKGQSGARYGLFMAPRGGMSQLIAALAARLPPPAVRLQSRVEALERGPSSWRIHVNGQDEKLTADGIILATPIHAAAELLQSLDPQAAELCRSVELSSAAVVSLGYDTRGTSFVPPGFGFVVPTAERRPILAASFASAKFPGRTPEGHVLVRVFVGGSGSESWLDRTDEELIRIAKDQLAELAGLTSPPVLSLVRRWPRSMPQYHVGHQQRMAGLHERTHALGSMALAGSAYHGVGIPHCIHSGELAAERVIGQERF
jgi:oxygen-dependent protoporphyrinogen oxidase